MSSNDDSDKKSSNSGTATIALIIAILFYICIKNYSKEDAIKDNLYYYWLYGLVKIILYSSTFGLTLILCCCMCYVTVIKSETCIGINMVLYYIFIILVLLVDIGFMCLLIDKNKDTFTHFKYEIDKQEMLQILCMISFVFDCMVICVFGCACLCSPIIIKEFCKKDLVSKKIIII